MVPDICNHIIPDKWMIIKFLKYALPDVLGKVVAFVEGYIWRLGQVHVMQQQIQEVSFDVFLESITIKFSYLAKSSLFPAINLFS